MSMKHIILKSALIVATCGLSTAYAAEPIGAIGGFKSLDKVDCKNKTTRQRVVIKNPNRDNWSCEGAGLTVDVGDKVTVEITGSAKGPVPYAPTDLVATLNPLNVSLGWTAMREVQLYNIYRSTSPNVNPALAFLLNTTGTNSFIDGDVVTGQTYYYVVTAVNGYGESEVSNMASITVRPLPFPTPAPSPTPAPTPTPTPAPSPAPTPTNSLTIDAGGFYLGVPGNAIQFNAIVASNYIGIPLTWSWDFGDGIRGEGVAPTHSYSAFGTFIATVTATNGSLTASDTATVTILNPTATGGLAGSAGGSATNSGNVVVP